MRELAGGMVRLRCGMSTTTTTTTTMATANVATTNAGAYDEVVVHPLVLLSVVDHFRRCDEVRATRRDALERWMICKRTERIFVVGFIARPRGRGTTR